MQPYEARPGQWVTDGRFLGVIAELRENGAFVHYIDETGHTQYERVTSFQELQRTAGPVRAFTDTPPAAPQAPQESRWHWFYQMWAKILRWRPW